MTAPLTPEELLRLAVRDLHRWDLSQGWGKFNTILGRIDDHLATLDAARAAAPESLDAVDIRATHPYGFRSGEWAALVGVEWANGRPCYRVRFPDGATDSWVLSDPSDPYEFRSKP